MSEPTKQMTILAVLPKINRQLQMKVSFSSNHDLAPQIGYLGCHFRWLSEVCLYPDFATLKAIDGGVVDKIKEAITGKDIVNPANHVDVNKALKDWVVPEAEKDRVFTLIAESFGKIRDKAESAYGPTPAGTPSGPTFVVMSDNINSYTPEFPKNSGIHDASKVSNGFKTCDFALWLAKNKIGLVTASPVGRNHWHQNSENFSLVQAWIWIPPHHVQFTVPGSHYITGLESQRTWPEWYNDVRTLASGMSKRTDEQIDERMWKGGKRNSHIHTLLEASGEEKVA